jgi:hypothetical protein
MLASSLLAPLAYTPLGVDIVKRRSGGAIAFCEAVGNGRSLERKVVVRIVVNCFAQKNWLGEGGSVRREVNGKAAKGDVEIMPV